MALEIFGYGVCHIVEGVGFVGGNGCMVLRFLSSSCLLACLLYFKVTAGGDRLVCWKL